MFPLGGYGRPPKRMRDPWKGRGTPARERVMSGTVWLRPEKVLDDPWEDLGDPWKGRRDPWKVLGDFFTFFPFFSSVKFCTKFFTESEKKRTFLESAKTNEEISLFFTKVS